MPKSKTKPETIKLAPNRCRQHPEMPHEHMHRCWKCDVVWGHTDASLGCDTCHECPLCGTEETWHWNWGTITEPYTSGETIDDEIPF